MLKGGTLAPYLLIICLDYALRTSIDFMKEAGKGKKRKIPRTKITDVDDADDITLPANTPTQAESLLQLLQWAAGGIGLHVNADKTECTCFNERGNISTLKGEPLKLVDKFTYLGSNVSSTEKDINMRLEKAWVAIDWLSVIRKSDLTDKIKRMWILLHWCTRWTLTKCMEKKFDGN